MKNVRTGFFIAALATAILLLLQTPVVASAQDYDQDDPPARAGRISFVQGSVSFQPGGEGDWVEGTQNRTLTVGDNLWVDRDSRAELQIGSTSIRLGPQTSLTFLDVRDDVTQLRLSVGSLYFRVRHFDHDDNFEVDTPNLAFNVNRPGQFRLDVNENGDQTIATVWRGEGEITGGSNSYRLMDGQQGTFSGTEQLSYDVAGIGRGDAFSDWAFSRDERFERSRSRQYVSEEMTGYEDLDDYGQWRNVSGYGNVWSPSGVPGDWAPYRYGHWVYISPWGWTWAEDEPWGFAPFHYGRWAYIQSSWCWVPGPVAVRPVYSPALVAFVGGGGFSLSIGVGGGGGVAWFPLAPGEVFVPWYRTSPRYVQNVNVTNTRVNVTQVTNVYNNVTVNKVTNVTYVNQRVNNSVTVVNHDTFVNARSVHNNIVRVDARQIASAPVTHQVREIQPQKQSLVGTARPIDRRPPQQVMTRQVVATRQPVAMNRPPAIAGVERRAAPPPMRTVKAAPPTQAQPLEKGAKGTGRPNAMNEGSPRPGGPPENRPNAAPRQGGPDNRANENRPNENRPNENRPNDNRPGTPRPGAQDNRENQRPNGIENRPGQPENRGAQQENNRAVPRPGNRPDQAPEQERPNNRPDNNRDNNRPDNNRPDNNRPDNKRPDNNRPDNNRTMETPSTRPEQPSRGPESRPEAAPRGNQNRPNENQDRPNMEPRGGQPNAPETREQRRPENRPEAAPRPDNRNREAAPRPDNQNQNVPRPDAQPRGGDNRPQDQQRGNDRGNSDKSDRNKDKDKDKNKPPQFR